MVGQTKRRSDLTLVPALLQESLYVGIDVGKYQHVAGFVSTTLLERHERFEGWPVLAFAQSRQGFCSLLERIRAYVSLEQAYVLYVRYNQRIKQEMLPQPEPLRDTEKTRLPQFGGTPHDRHMLGTVPTGGNT